MHGLFFCCRLRGSALDVGATGFHEYRVWRNGWATLDHSVGALKTAEALRPFFWIDDEVEFHRLLDRQVTA